MGSSRERLVYLVDFGLARSYLATQDGKMQLRKKRKTVPFRGTVRYCSLNVHSQEEQGRHDDLWSLIYMLMEMYLGNLPWTNYDREKTERCKIDTEHELVQKCPKEIDTIVGHLKNLNYASIPNYAMMRALFCRVIVHSCPGGKTSKLDWERGGHLEKALRRQSLLQREGNSQQGPTLDQILQLNRAVDMKSTETIPLIPLTKEYNNMTHSSIDDTIESPPKGKEEKKEEVAAARQATSTGPMSGKYAYNRGKSKM